MKRILCSLFREIVDEERKRFENRYRKTETLVGGHPSACFNALLQAHIERLDQAVDGIHIQLVPHFLHGIAQLLEGRRITFARLEAA